jgi:hypothetical protein
VNLRCRREYGEAPAAKLRNLLSHNGDARPCQIDHTSEQKRWTVPTTVHAIGSKALDSAGDTEN